MSVLSSEAKRGAATHPMAKCQGKHPFDSFALALATATRGNRNSGGAKRYGVYRCSHCGSYHVGNTPAMLKRKRTDFKNRCAAAKEQSE